MSMRDKIAKAILGGKVGGPTPSGIHVYHSSPHDFDRFDLGKIGTGEGAQVYGHGIYAAENPAVSGRGGQYWDQFTRRFPENENLLAAHLRSHGFDRDAALAANEARIEHLRKFYANEPGKADPAIARLTQQNIMLREQQQIGPRTYEVNFKAKPEELLDWDKPLAGQPAYQRLREHWDAKIGDPDIIAQRLDMGEAPTGAKPYQSLTGIGRNQPAASRMLNEAGIPGIRYLDEGSRNIPQHRASLESDIAKSRAAGDQQLLNHYEGFLSRLPQPTHNYVAFDPSRLDIMAKYGVVGGVPLGAATMSGAFDPATYGERQ